MKDNTTRNVTYEASQIAKRRAQVSSSVSAWRTNPERTRAFMEVNAEAGTLWVYDKPSDTLFIYHPLFGFTPINHSRDLDLWQSEVRNLERTFSNV